MDALLLLVELVVWLLDILGAFGDVYLWFKAKENRAARRDARKTGGEPVPLDQWNRRFIALGVVVVVLTLSLLLWKFR